MLFAERGEYRVEFDSRRVEGNFPECSNVGGGTELAPPFLRRPKRSIPSKILHLGVQPGREAR
jgi:hypothetical protein